MKGTILDHYLSGNRTLGVGCLSSYIEAVEEMLQFKCNPYDAVSVKRFFDLYDTKIFTDEEYIVEHRVFMCPGKPDKDPLERPYRPCELTSDQ